jgi:hypothetical protein
MIYELRVHRVVQDRMTALLSDIAELLRSIEVHAKLSTRGNLRTDRRVTQ